MSANLMSQELRAFFDVSLADDISGTLPHSYHIAGTSGSVEQPSLDQEMQWETVVNALQSSHTSGAAPESASQLIVKTLLS
jgi:hypothetical protein